MIGPITRASIRSFLLLTLCLGLALPAPAFIPVAQNDDLEILLPEFDLHGYVGYDRDVGSRGVETVLSARLDGQWRVHSWNPQTDTPHWTYGAATKMTNAVTGEEHLVELARRVIAEQQDVLNADLANLRVIATPHALGKWVAHFQQTYDGLDVHDAKVRIAFSDAGKLMLMGSDYYRDIDLNSNPSIDADAATQLARAAVDFNPATDSIDGEAVLLVLPYPLSPTVVEHHLVWRVRVRTEDPLGIWVSHVDAHTGEILWRYNDIHFAYGGDTDTDVQIYGYCDGITNMTVPYLNIDVSDVGTATSDYDGDWTIAGSGGDRTVSAYLEGPYAWVRWNSGGPLAYFSGTAAEDVPFTVDFDDNNAQHDERDVFDAVNDIHDFFQLFAPEFTFAHSQMQAEVSINSTCNAYWDGNIHFYREGDGCANTGEMQQVVHHEYGHGIQAAILGGQGGQGLGEGNADINGNLITQDPIIGRGFFLDDCINGIRTSDNDLIYPDDVIGIEIHAAGRVIAGFNWDAMILLQDLYGGGMNWNGAGTLMSAERWHYGRILGHPNTQPDQVFWTFVADDDDGDLDNGTPNHAIFCEAAANHNFDCPEILFGVIFEHTPVSDTIDDANPYPVDVTVYSTEAPIDAGTVAMFWRVNSGAWTEVAMSPGGGDIYEAEIPAQPLGSIIDYYFYAEDTSGLYGTAPSGAPGNTFSFLIAWVVDDIETDLGWTVGMAGDNATDGIWERGNPIGTIAQPEDDHTEDGSFCWFTGQNSMGGPPGIGDVDGRTTVLSPSYDLTGASNVHVRYWKWYSNNLGSNMGGDTWEVYVSNNGGMAWETVEFTDVSTNAWVSVLFALTDYFPLQAPGFLRLRFTAEDGDPPSLVEAAVDDIVIQAFFDDLTSAGDGLTVAPVQSMDQNYPNPFNPKTAISFSLREAGPVDLGVFDARGCRLVTLAAGNLAVGEHRVVWDGNDADGQPVAAGVYFYRLDAGGRQTTKRMVLIK